MRMPVWLLHAIMYNNFCNYKIAHFTKRIFWWYIFVAHAGSADDLIRPCNWGECIFYNKIL